MAKDLKRVAIVAAHFVPSNLAAVHRARLWSLYLREFGWDPTIVTTHWDYYEEPPEFELMNLVPPDLRVIRTKALRTRPLRAVGDIGIRGLRWHYSALLGLARRGEIEFLHITIPSFYSAMLGRLIKQKSGIPYGIDYIDPWVHHFPGADRLFSRAWVSTRLAEWLEPWAVREASLITGINRRYYDGVLQRNPHLSERAVLAAMPYGGSEKDHEYVRQHPRPAKLLERCKGMFNLVYAGAMLPKAYEVLDRFFEALLLLRQRRPRLAAEFHLHFIGTGKSPNDHQGFNILPRAEQRGLAECVSEYPSRLPYLDVLTHLDAASGVLVLGSTEPHYSPSKVFQSLMSRRPVFSLLHEQSTAVPILRTANAGPLVTLTESALPTPDVLASALEQFVYANGYAPDRVRWEVLAQYSARESARTLARALDQAT